MDPQVTWNELIQKWQQSEWQDVLLLAESLLDWLHTDGFPPATIGTLSMGLEWNRTVASAVCRMAITRAKSVLESPHGLPADVPFTLSCDTCGHEGPETYREADDEGWTQIRYTPNGLSENFLGYCPHCRIEETQPE